MSSPILANKWLCLVSTGKIFWALLALSPHPLQLLSESVRVAQVNVILAYFCLFFLPMAQRKIRYYSKDLARRWEEDTMDIEVAEELLARRDEAEEIQNYLRYAR